MKAYRISLTGLSRIASAVGLDDESILFLEYQKIRRVAFDEIKRTGISSFNLFNKKHLIELRKERGVVKSSDFITEPSKRKRKKMGGGKKTIEST